MRFVRGFRGLFGAVGSSLRLLRSVGMPLGMTFLVGDCFFRWLFSVAVLLVWVRSFSLTFSRRAHPFSVSVCFAEMPVDMLLRNVLSPCSEKRPAIGLSSPAIMCAIGCAITSPSGVPSHVDGTPVQETGGETGREACRRAICFACRALRRGKKRLCRQAEGRAAKTRPSRAFRFGDYRFPLGAFLKCSLRSVTRMLPSLSR